MSSKKKRAPRLALSIFCVLLVIAIASQISNAGERAFVREDEITYGKIGDFELKLDLARPAGNEGPFPALVFILGSGWRYYRGLDRGQYYDDIGEAAARGYVAVTVDHRPINVKERARTKYPFPAQVHDVKCAVRWLRANAEKYKIDPNRIGAVGWSSGGHLALMLGLTDPSDGLEGECGNPDISSRVQAVVSIAGPTELFSMYPDRDVVDLLGGTPEEVPEQYKAASPLTYATEDDPPVLTIHGEMDGSVPPKHAELLDAKMKEIGASHTLIIKELEGHRDFIRDKAVLEFFDGHLKGDE